MQGVIIKSISGEYIVHTSEGNIVTKPLGIFRHRNVSPKVGDNVIVEDRMITEILPRKNDLTRPNVANVDKIFILTSFTEPNLNLNLLDRLISISEWEHLKIILVFTKKDLVNLKDFARELEYYKKLSYPVYLMPGDEEGIKKEIENNICVVAGQSGVGKSTMINAIGKSLNIPTDEISKALGRGKHTTRHVEIHAVAGGWIADTPGFGISDLQMELVELSHTFIEFFNSNCRFSECLHIKEPGCEVKKKVESKEILQSRYDNYLNFVEEINNRKKPWE